MAMMMRIELEEAVWRNVNSTLAGLRAGGSIGSFKPAASTVFFSSRRAFLSSKAGRSRSIWGELQA